MVLPYIYLAASSLLASKENTDSKALAWFDVSRFWSILHFGNGHTPNRRNFPAEPFQQTN